jgi:hypothetical protein
MQTILEIMEILLVFSPAQNGKERIAQLEASGKAW